MTIGIDARLINETGVGVYIENLLINLSKMEIDFQFIIFTTEKGKRNIQSYTDKFEIHTTNIRWHSFEEQTLFLYKLYQHSIDLMHFPYFSYPILYHRPFVITIHDLTPLLFKTGAATTLPKPLYYIKYQAYKFAQKKGIENSKAILTPSHAIKKEIINYYGEDLKDKITVTNEGVNASLVTAKPNNNLERDFNKPFLFRLGNFLPHKNIERLLTAFSELQTPVKLVLAGPCDYFADIVKELVNILNLTDRVTFFYNPTIEDRVFFYENALGLVQPSLVEGFGLPLIEAKYFNCPIIASRIPVFEELLGSDFPYFFDPYKSEDIKNVLQKFLSHHTTRQDSEPNKDILKTYSFEKMTEQTLSLYKNVLDS